MDGFVYEDLEYLGPERGYRKRLTDFFSNDGRILHWRPHGPLIRLFGRELEINYLAKFLISWTGVYFGRGHPAYEIVRKFAKKFWHVDVIMRSAYTFLAGAANRPVNAAHNFAIDLALTSGHLIWSGIQRALLGHESVVLGGYITTGFVALVGDSEEAGRYFFTRLYGDLLPGHWMTVLENWINIHGQAIGGLKEVTDDRFIPLEQAVELGDNETGDDEPSSD